jgi:glyoxylase-like metal-dependent hydrolase (beta-lactamase superfamily II)
LKGFLLLKIIQDITSTIKLLNSHIEIPGYDNYIATYLMLGEKKAIVDIGPRIAVSGRLESLNEAGLKPEEIDFVILTHIHIDHAGGTGTALKSMKNARVIVHPRGKQHLIDPEALWNASLESSRELSLEYGQYEPVAEERVLTAKEGMKLDLGKGIVLEFIITPGHASHHMSIFEHSSKVIFAGDSAGLYTSRVLRLTAPPPFRPVEYLNSIDRMIALHPQLLAYAHFGCYPDAVTRLKLVKEKVRSWLDIARKGAKTGKTPDQVAHDIIEEDPELGYFKTLNKDEFARDNHQFVLTVSGLMTAK